MKLYGLGFNGGSKRGGFSAAPVATVAPVMASQPGTYGGPPGSFETRGACPPGYSRIAIPGPGVQRSYRCIPRAAAPAPAPAPAPVYKPPPAPIVKMAPITVSPIMQQSFTPQFSPVMQMAQDSPGMTQAAAPEQIASPEQVAETIATPSTIPSAPSAPLPVSAPIDYGPPPPSAPSFDTPQSAPVSMPASFSDWPASPAIKKAIEAEQGKDNIIPWIIGAAGLGLFLFTRKSEGKAR